MVGKSGGQLLVWDTTIFEAISVIRGDYFIGVSRKWIGSGSNCNIVSVYGPHDDSGKQKFWDELSKAIVSDVNNAWVLCGDFNEVRNEAERFNCDFIEYMAKRFNDFVSDNCLIEIPMSGRIYTRVSGDGLKFSKLDRFLVTENFLHTWKDLTACIMDRHLSDHCAIILMDEERDFGPKPFKIFDAWLDDEEVSKVIEDAWDKEVAVINRKDCVFRNRLKNVKNAIKDWSRNRLDKLDVEIEMHKSIAKDLELRAEVLNLNETELENWKNSRKCENQMGIGGDENSKFFHSVMRMRNNRNTIRGLLIDGVWNNSPDDIKAEVALHFANRFKECEHERPSLDEMEYYMLNASEAASLEVKFDEKEIREAIFDCDGNKAPGSRPV
ncbi:uncharacterized protein [Rutidosis leptorrhynchoides]|uniref:uncharacterized protein n=1 Tax=Rutidosis leptorrhynchoides TaxID=125765 RepID=UPI003A994216